jgi:hypothetical protein
MLLQAFIAAIKHCVHLTRTFHSLPNRIERQTYRSLTLVECSSIIRKIKEKRLVHLSDSLPATHQSSKLGPIKKSEPGVKIFKTTASFQKYISSTTSNCFSCSILIPVQNIESKEV